MAKDLFGKKVGIQIVKQAIGVLWGSLHLLHVRCDAKYFTFDILCSPFASLIECENSVHS